MSYAEKKKRKIQVCIQTTTSVKFRKDAPLGISPTHLISLPTGNIITHVPKISGSMPSKAWELSCKCPMAHPEKPSVTCLRTSPDFEQREGTLVCFDWQDKGNVDAAQKDKVKCFR